jgi:hypothetical protein
MNSMKRKRLNPRLAASSSIKVIGLGGVGSIVARYVSVFLASTGKDARLLLIDGDKFEPSNASRMLFGRHGNKAEVIRAQLAPHFRHSRLLLETAKHYITPENIETFIMNGDIVLLCVDNHATRHLVDEHCAKLRNICLISGGNDGVGKDSSGKLRLGTYGNVQIHVRKGGKTLSPRLSKYHPEIKHPADKMPHQKNCTELVVSVPQILFANLSVASAMCNALLLHLSGALQYAEASFDIAEGLMRPTIKK